MPRYRRPDLLRLVLPAGTVFLASALASGEPSGTRPTSRQDLTRLPAPRQDGPVSVERALAHRRSARQYMSGALSMEEVAQLLWAAQGVTQPSDAPAGWPSDWQWLGGLRTAPSAGALYPLEVYMVAGSVEGLLPGVYRYAPNRHALEILRAGDHREALTEAALRQTQIRQAAVVIVLAGVYQRTSVKYGDRATRYVHMEAGAAGENLHLQAEALGLGTVFIGAFQDQAVKEALEMPGDHEPLLIMPVGRKSQG
jgi:SagB-type dehydrogenase family enzyme